MGTTSSKIDREAEATNSENYYYFHVDKDGKLIDDSGY
jgi:hypothetical protein